MVADPCRVLARDQPAPPRPKFTSSEVDIQCAELQCGYREAGWQILRASHFTGIVKVTADKSTLISTFSMRASNLPNRGEAYRETTQCDQWIPAVGW